MEVMRDKKIVRCLFYSADNTSLAQRKRRSRYFKHSWKIWRFAMKFMRDKKIVRCLFYQADNASLAQRLRDAEDELSNLENLLDKEEVLERLDELKGDINRKRSAVREPLNDQDELGQALAELHQKYIDLMRDLDRERRKQVCKLFFR